MSINQITADGGGNQLTGQMRTWYTRIFIEELNPKLLYSQFGVNDSVPLRNGRTISWPTMDPLDAGETLLESSDGTEGTITLDSISATLADYGKHYKFSSRVSLEAPDPVLETFVTRLARRASRTIDEKTRDGLSGSTNIHYTGSHTADNQIVAGDVIAAADLEQLIANFEDSDVEPVTDYLSPNGGSATVPGEPAYVAIAHSHVINDMRKNKSTNGWVNSADYQQGNSLLPGEAGMTDKVRWLNAGSGGKFVADAGVGNVDVYHTHVFGADAFGTVDLAMRPAQIWLVPTGQETPSNPLGRRGSVGWTAEHAVAILQDSALQVVHSSSSFGANT